MLFISKTLPYSFCACIGNKPKIVTFVIRKMELVSFRLFLDAFPPRPKTPFTFVVNVYRDMSLTYATHLVQQSEDSDQTRCMYRLLIIRSHISAMLDSGLTRFDCML